MRKAIVLLAALVALPSFSAVDTTTVSGKVLLPSGAAATGGKIVCELSQAASAADGAGVQRVASRVTATIGTDGSVSIPLAPNDILTPAGTYYTCKFTIITPASASWTEKWSLASSPDPVDIGSVSRLDVAPGTTTGVYVVALATCSGACPNGGVCIDKDDAAQYYCYLGNWTRQDLPPCSPDPPVGACTDGGVCQSVSSGWALYGCYSGAWAAVTGSGGSSVAVDGAAVGNPDFVDTGDIDFDATPTGQIIGTIQADSVALSTDTTGDYVSGVTTDQGLLKTGTEGATLGLIDCSAGQILKRNVGDTGWECASDDTAVGGTVSISGTPATNQIGVWASSSGMKGDSDLTFDGTNRLTATNLTVTNTITGNAATATALAADGANCSASQYPLGVDASGAVQSCTADDDTPDTDGEVPDAITISATGSVAWTALTSYPAACSAGQYVSTIGDTLTCGTPAMSTATSLDADADGTANVTADADSVDFSLDGTGTVARVGSDGSYIQVAATADGSRGATFQDNTVEPTAPSSGYTLLYALGGELYKKDNGDSTTERLLLNSGNLAGDVTADATGNVSIGNDKVTEADLKAVNSATDEYCLTYETTTGDFEWQSCGSSSGYATVQDEASGLTQRTTINFTGAGVSCADNAGSSRTDCTISGGGSTNSFETINASSGTDPVADSTTDTLNLTAGSGITITGDSSSDTITIAATGSAGVDPWDEVKFFEDFIDPSNYDPPSSASNNICPLWVVDDTTSTPKIFTTTDTDSATLGTGSVGSCHIPVSEGDGNGYVVAFGAPDRSLTASWMAYNKMREFRTRFKTGPSNWSTASTRNILYAFGGFAQNGAANVVDETQLTTGVFFLCSPMSDLDGDSTPDDGVEDNDWMMVVSNDQDGTFDFCYSSGGGCTTDPDVTWTDTNIDCTGSGRNSLYYELDLTFDGTNVVGKIDDNDDTSSWTYTSGNITTDVPSAAFSAAWGMYHIGMTGVPVSMPIAIDWLYYKGVR